MSIRPSCPYVHTDKSGIHNKHEGDSSNLHARFQLLLPSCQCLPFSNKATNLHNHAFLPNPNSCNFHPTMSKTSLVKQMHIGHLLLTDDAATGNSRSFLETIATPPLSAFNCELLKGRRRWSFYKLLLNLLRFVCLIKTL